MPVFQVNPSVMMLAKAASEITSRIRCIQFSLEVVEEIATDYIALAVSCQPEYYQLDTFLRFKDILRIIPVFKNNP